MTISAETKSLVALTALNAMLRKSYFCICTLRRVADMLDVPVVGSEAWKVLEPLHCVDYAAMPPELIQQLPELIATCLRVEPIHQFTAEAKNKPRRFLELVRS